MMPESSVLVVGDRDRPEFQAACSAPALGCRVVTAVDAAAALDELARGDLPPDLIIVVQSRPDQYSAEALDRLRRAAPLARVLGLLGTWCEGEGRTGSPWRAALGIYWHQWAVRYEQELRRASQGDCPSWGLPATATDDERLLWAHTESRPPRQGLVVIHARDFEVADWLAAACRARGLATVWQTAARQVPVTGAAAAVWDGTDGSAAEASDLRRLAESLGRVPVLALGSFLRVEGRRRLIDAGAAAVLSKPLLLADLYWELDRLLAPAEEQTGLLHKS